MEIPTLPQPVVQRPSRRSPIANLLAAFCVGILVVIVGVYFWQRGIKPTTPSEQKPKPDEASVRAFSSEDDFKLWLAKAEGVAGLGSGLPMRTMELGMPAPTMMGKPMVDDMVGAPKEVAAPDRVSTTNVQVSGIDEPDIVKTDGQEIYFSPEQYWYWARPMMPMMLEEPVSIRAEETKGEGMMIAPPEPPKIRGVKTVKAFPPSDLKVDSELARNGSLLLSRSSLVVFANEGVYGYDVANPAAPVEKWKMSYENNHQFVSARLYGDKIYLVMSAGINHSRPCPIMPMKLGETSISIPCGDIYHPIRPVAAEATYSVVLMNPGTGEVSQSVSFVGTWDSTNVYMSPSALYITSALPGDFFSFIHNFFLENTSLVPAEVIERLGKIRGYDLSDQAKMVEFQTIIERWQRGLSNDDSLKLQNELENRTKTYLAAHQRELWSTGLVKISTSDLKVVATGSVPGGLLNQFSMDEYNSYLRVATTTGGRWLPFGLGGGGAESVNDVYVLDQNLKQVGQVLDLGKGERIYSVRFIEDKGYVVTFKQIDPFYVLDLRDPSKPVMRGELKIPGFSSYLHPVSRDRILGVGMEEGKVKISLFDVADPANPTEKSKYSLDEYWTEVQNTHHAFLLDSKHEIFFMPGGKGGYIFSYRGDKLSLTKAVAEIQAKRALYINDYLYIVGEDKIVVLNQADWERVNQLTF